MKQKEWVVAERLTSDLEDHLLQLRLGGVAEVERDAYVHPDIADLSSPAMFKGMNVAVARIVKAIREKEAVVVWGDFDADGVTSTAIMWETLHQLGATVLPYIPNRDSEGHGFSDDGLAKLAADGTKLLVTVDHGISAIEEAAQIAALGMEVIITDHHEPRLRSRAEDQKSEAEEFELPEAVAIIHPLLSEKPQPLAGCGVAYMLAYAVWLEVTGNTDAVATRTEFAQDKIELVTIGTIADMVPLLGDNRIFATFGLPALQKTSRVGLTQLYKLAGLANTSRFGTYEVGFSIGPRLNAPGRLGDALESLRLLCTRDETRARRLAQDLNDLNMQRQELLAQVAEEAKQEAHKHADGVFVLANRQWPAGVCGLAAGKVVEQFYRPTVVMEEMGEYSRGSARSIKGFDFTAALGQIAELLESYGGHAMAAGFRAKTENLAEIEARLSELFWFQFDKQTLRPVLSIDAEISPEEITWETYHMLQQLEPCGMGNPKPVLMLSKAQVVDYRVVGSDGKHVKLTVRASDRPTTFEAIAFNFGHWVEQLQQKPMIDVAFGLDCNEWNGKKTLQLAVKDLRLTEKN